MLLHTQYLRLLFTNVKKINNTSTRVILSSFTETTSLYTLRQLIVNYLTVEKHLFFIFYNLKQDRELANCVLKDMIHLTLCWRQIRGYPQGGNTTHTNASNSKKTKILFNFRVQQFFKLFGKKSRNIYPTLIKAEYTNRLWYYNWPIEWEQSYRFALRMIFAGQKAGSFNPALLATNQVNGFTRIGKAAKLSKAKKLTKVFTLGAPLLFTRYIYWSNTPRGFPKIILRDEINKRLGKKLKRSEYRDKKQK